MLIRAVIENCSHAMWVIGDEPTEDPETRLARAYLEEFLSTDEAKKTAGRLGAKTEPSYIAAHENYVRLKRQIITRFPGTTKSDLGNLTLAGQTLPRPEACVAWMYALLHKAAGSPIDERVALGIYGFLSNMTHPTLYPARQLRDWATDPATGHHVAFLRLDVGFLERQASSAVSAFYNALSYVTSYFGWDSATKDDLTSKIDSAMPRFFTN